MFFACGGRRSREIVVLKRNRPKVGRFLERKVENAMIHEYCKSSCTLFYKESRVWRSDNLKPLMLHLQLLLRAKN